MKANTTRSCLPPLPLPLASPPPGRRLHRPHPIRPHVPRPASLRVRRGVPPRARPRGRDLRLRGRGRRAQLPERHRRGVADLRQFVAHDITPTGRRCRVTWTRTRSATLAGPPSTSSASTVTSGRPPLPLSARRSGQAAPRRRRPRRAPEHGRDRHHQRPPQRLAHDGLPAPLGDDEGAQRLRRRGAPARHRRARSTCRCRHPDAAPLPIVGCSASSSPGSLARPSSTTSSSTVTAGSRPRGTTSSFPSSSPTARTATATARSARSTA